jgi:hypothetical protein
VPTPPKPIPFTNFGGLILNKSLDDVGADNAIDLLDVDWPSSASVLHSREGAKALTAAAAFNYNSLFAHSDTRLLTRRGVKTLVVVENAGVEIAGKEATTAERHLAFARVGTPTASYSYIADQENTLKRYDGTSFTEPKATVDGVAEKAMPKGKSLATWTDEGNRLVIAGTAPNGGPNGAISSGSHVWFAKPGEPEGYESTAFVQLDPGDGENIVGCCVWSGMLFVFKETRLFVFYGVSADDAGKPVFNFRSVDLGTRILPPGVNTGEQIVAGTDSVYFVSNDGVWATTGSEPALLSADLDPLAHSQALIGPAATTFGTRRWTDAKGIAVVGEVLYVGLGAAEVDRLLKFDLREQRWTVWSASLFSMAAWNEETATHRMRLFFSGSGAGNKKLYFYTPAENADPTVAMEPRWQSGFYELEEADEKTFVATKLWGTGEVTVKVAEDYKALGNGVKYKLGVAPAIAQRQKQRGQSATLFSHQFSGAAPWSVQRLDRYLRETRVPETQKP